MMQIYYELVYEDGMTHSSFNQELIMEIWNNDIDIISHMTMKVCEE
tara:strand:- start:563 stop:700 length:138 start_codon:yes stop_codon:yes gene_type:complete